MKQAVTVKLYRKQVEIYFVPKIARVLLAAMVKRIVIPALQQHKASQYHKFIRTLPIVHLALLHKFFYFYHPFL